MKKASFVLILCLFLVFLAGGVFGEDSLLCISQGGACCIGDLCVTADYMCVEGTTAYSDGCDENCHPIGDCKNLTCITEPGKAYYPGTEKCCDNLKSILPEGYYDENCNELDVVGAPLCAPCGNGKCESQYEEDKCNCPEDCSKTITCAKEGEMYSFVYDEYPKNCCEGLTEWASGMDSRIVENGICKETGLLKGAPVGTCIKCGDSICGPNENVCNCAEDCKADCTKNENNRSCCKNGICIGLFDDGLPSSCDNGRLPVFYGCDPDCQPTFECGISECKTSKDCWDKYKNCDNICEDETCVFDSLTSNASLGYPNCLEEVEIPRHTDVICAPDKKQCADGSFVGRAGFDCKFMPCPEVKQNIFQKIISWFKNLFN